MSEKKKKNLLETITVCKDECFLSGNVGDILHLRSIEEKLLNKLRAME